MRDYLRKTEQRVEQNIPYHTAIDLRDYAKDIDPKGNHDSATGYRKALGELPSNGGDIIVAPGAYLIGSKVEGKKPGVRMLGLGGHSWRSGSTGETSSTFGRAPVAIMGGTAGMTVFEFNGVGNAGTTIEQAGPTFENIAFFDNIGRLANTPGDMTLVSLRLMNRWAFYECSFNWAGIGVKANKDDEDCANWVIHHSDANGCVVGMDLNAYSGTVSESWFTRCGKGIHIARSVSETNPPGTIRIRDCKFDILNPVSNPTYTPGYGIHIEVAQTVYIDNVSFEENGNPSAPDAQGIVIEGSTSFNRVYVDGCLSQNMDYGIRCDTARHLGVKSFDARQASAVASAAAAIAVDTCQDYSVFGARSINNTRIPFTITTNTALSKLFSVEGDVVGGATTVSDMPLQFWRAATCKLYFDPATEAFANPDKTLGFGLSADSALFDLDFLRSLSTTSAAGGAIRTNNGGSMRNSLVFRRDFTTASLPIADTQQALAYSTTIATNPTSGPYCTITVTDGVAFTISSPSPANAGVWLTYDILNSSGGSMGTITWGAAFVLVGGPITKPADGKHFVITFEYDGTNWIERARTQLTDAYAPGSFVIPDGQYRVMADHLTLGASDVLTIEGDGCLAVI